MAASLHAGTPLRLRIAVIAIALAPALIALAVHTADRRAPGAGPFTDARPVRGVAMVVHHVGDLPRYLRSVEAIEDLGANALVVVTPWFQRTAESSEIRPVPEKCPTDAQLRAILDRATSRGLRTVLQPIVLIEEPGEKDWRGLIRPADWSAWWASYDRMIDHFLAIAVAADVDLFTVGSELNSTEHQVDRWDRVVRTVRGRFDGQVAYSANWDRYDVVPFWELVDVIGVSSYFELERDDHDAPRAALAAAWAPHVRDLVALGERERKPVLISEVGYPSLPWAAAHPWNYVAEDGVVADHDAQARAWSAFFDAWTPVLTEDDGPVLGFFAYHWDPYHRGGAGDTGYGVRGKPAATVVEEGFRSLAKERRSRFPVRD